MIDITAAALILLLALLVLFLAIYDAFRQREKRRQWQRRAVELHESQVRQAKRDLFYRNAKEADKLDDNGSDASARG